MIDYLESLDRLTAAGIFARAALALENEANPAAMPIVPNEPAIRERVIQDLRLRAGIAPADDTSEARERLLDALDEESDALLAPPDSERVLRDLAVKGSLPSDLYQIFVIPNIRDIYGRKFDEEYRHIEAAVRAPDFEEHYGPSGDPSQPHLISLFAKSFPNKYPARTFIMLVAGSREGGLTLSIHQAWRIYPEDVDLVGATSPLEMLKRFAEKYGFDVTVGGQRGRFILVAEIPRTEKVPVLFSNPTKNGKSHTIMVSHFVQSDSADGRSYAALVVSIDLDKYLDSLQTHGW